MLHVKEKVRMYESQLDHTRPTRQDAPRRAGITSGLAQVTLEQKRHAVPAEHLAKFAQFAADHDVVLVLRASTPGSDRYKLAGHATKPLAVKAKTCDFGIARALVCCNPRYSKLRGDAEAVAKAEANIAALLGDPKSDMVAAQLTLAPDDLRHLREQGEIEISGSLGHGDLTIRSRNGEGGHENFSAKLQDGLYRIVDRHGEALEVLASLAHGATSPSSQARMLSQLTADYDLAMIAPRLDARGTRHNVRKQSLPPHFLDHLTVRSAPSAPPAGAPTDDLTRVQAELFGDYQFGTASPAPAEPAPEAAVSPTSVRGLVARFESLKPAAAAPTGAAAEPGGQHAPARKLSAADVLASRRGSVASSRGGFQFRSDRKSSAYGVVSEADQDYIRDLNRVLKPAAGERSSPDLIHHGAANNIRSDDEAYRDCVIFFPKAFEGAEAVSMADDKPALDALLQIARSHGYPCLFERGDQFPHDSPRASMITRGSLPGGWSRKSSLAPETS